MRKDWHTKQIENDTRIYRSLTNIMKLLNSDLLANHMETRDIQELGTMIKKLEKIREVYNQRKAPWQKK